MIQAKAQPNTWKTHNALNISSTKVDFVLEHNALSTSKAHCGASWTPICWVGAPMKQLKRVWVMWYRNDLRVQTIKSNTVGEFDGNIYMPENHWRDGQPVYEAGTD